VSGYGGADRDEAGLIAAASAYETALRDNDLDALDRLFAPGTTTLRAEGGTAIVGHAAISDFRSRRGGAPARWLRRVHVRWTSPTDALTVSETERLDGGRGLQTQLWHLGEDGWQVVAAHVSGAPLTAPLQPVEDAAIWRVSGDPLLRGAGTGALAGVRVAVKDLVAVAGQAVGGGVPRWLEGADREPASAPVLQRLLDAGAVVAGIAQTDELAFSLMGVNEHYGTPHNAAAPGRVPGGSSSGSAAAVAAGLADLGLGTDTAGSLRVPGSFSALYAWRPTHGVVDITGVLPLAQSFDTVGLLARDAALLADAASTLLPAADVERPKALLRSATLLGLADAPTRLAVEAALTALAVQTGLPVVDLADDFTPAEATAWTTAFRTLQAAEAWANDGAFIQAHPGALSPSVEARFRHGVDLDPADLTAARAVVDATRTRLDAVLAQGFLALPSTATPAPRTDATAEEFEAARGGTLQLSTLASQTGVPALGLPWGRVGELPVGLCLLAPRGADRSLLALLAEVAPARG
jgi:amidase